MSEYQSAKRFIGLIIRVKFDWVSRFPWWIGCLAHDNVKVARRTFGVAYNSFRAMADRGQILQHPRVVLICSTLSHQRDEFLAGTALSALPESEEQKNILKNICCSDHSAEKEHRTVSQTVTACRHGPVLVSLERRLPFLERDLLLQPQLLSSLIDHFDKARHVKKRLRSFVFLEKPFSASKAKQGIQWTLAGTQ